MKAISVRQPWARFIADGSKNVEVRTWRTSYRGPLLICSSSRQDQNFEKLERDVFALGVALCVVDLCDIEPMSPAHVKAAYPCDDESLWQGEDFGGQYAWLLKDPRVVLDPFPVKGKLNFFEVETPPGFQTVPSDEFFTDDEPPQ